MPPSSYLNNSKSTNVRFDNFVEEEFHPVTFPPIEDQMLTLTAAAGDLPEESVQLANIFLSWVG